MDIQWSALAWTWALCCTVPGLPHYFVLAALPGWLLDFVTSVPKGPSFLGTTFLCWCLGLQKPSPWSPATVIMNTPNLQLRAAASLIQWVGTVTWGHPKIHFTNFMHPKKAIQIWGEGVSKKILPHALLWTLMTMDILYLKYHTSNS